MTASIFLVEGRRLVGDSFSPALRKRGYTVLVYSRLGDVIRKGEETTFDVLVIDAASKRTSGRRLAQEACKQLNQPVILVAPEGSKVGLYQQGLTTLVRPLTHRKLLNVIALMTSVNSGVGKEIVAGRLRLIPETRGVLADGRITQLTPKQYDLLMYLMEHRGEVVTREALMQNVWHTNYFGDTRTLDVHINRLRSAMAGGSNKPALIKTFKGMGYMFDIGNSK